MGILDYRERDNDLTKNALQHTEAFYGYEPTKPLLYDWQYEELYRQILEKIQPYLPFRKRKVILSKSSEIWQSLGLKLHKIYTMDSQYLKCDGNKITLMPEALEHISIVEPHQLPIQFLQEKNNYLGLLKNTTLTIGHQKVVLYNKIFLSYILNQISLCVYNHEITHTQLNGNNLGTSYLNMETLPMIIEEVIADYIDPTGDTLTIIRNFHLYEVAEYLRKYTIDCDMPYQERLISDCYIKSIMQAIYIVNKYLKGNRGYKRELLDYCNKIFSYQRTIDEMLVRYEASLEQVPKKLAKLQIPK